MISCLENFYETLKGKLTKPIRDRIENDPGPIQLKAARADEVVADRRPALESLYESARHLDPRGRPDFPFPRPF